MRSPEHDATRRVAWRLATVGAFALSAFFVWLGLSQVEGAPRKTRKLTLPDQLFACATDAECVLVNRIGCCSCDVGGARWAITDGQQDALRLFLKKGCRFQPACIQVNACADDLVAACRQGRCVAEPIPAAHAEAGNG